jgi:hypothetical protein
MPCLRQSSWTPMPAWASLSTAMICSAVCRFRVMAPSCGAHLSTLALPSQWPSFRGESHHGGTGSESALSPIPALRALLCNSAKTTFDTEIRWTLGGSSAEQMCCNPAEQTRSVCRGCLRPEIDLAVVSPVGLNDIIRGGGNNDSAAMRDLICVPAWQNLLFRIGKCPCVY